jgi:hypothetical protein
MNPFLALVLAGLSNVVLGMIWYNPKIFGTAWMRMSNITPEAAERSKKNMPLMAIVGFFAALFSAWVLSVVQNAFGVFDVISALDVGFWIWAGFIAPILLGSVLWEGKPFSLYLINAAFWLLALLSMSAILAR